jgi:hypothetical protein
VRSAVSCSFYVFYMSRTCPVIRNLVIKSFFLSLKLILTLHSTKGCADVINS